MQRPELVICTPVRGAEWGSAPVAVGYSETLRWLSHEMPVHEIPPVITATVDVGRARNRLAALVLREFPFARKVLWWDDDLWPEDRRVAREMLDTTADVVAAPYTNKTKPLRWVHWRLDPCPPSEGPLMPVRGVGFGFTMTTLACLRAMSDRARIYTDWPSTNKVADIFGHLYEPHPQYPDDRERDSKLSEDFSFCKRWREDLGGKVYIYEKAGILRHAGPHAWSAEEMPGGVVG